MEEEAYWKQDEKGRRRARVVAGLLLVTAGLLFIGREAGMLIPGWVFSWKMLLIAIGLVLGVRHNFRRPAWAILMLIGGGFILAEHYNVTEVKNYVVPIVLIVIGLFFIFRPRRRPRYDRCRGRWQKRYGHYAYPGNPGDPKGPAGISGATDEEYLDSVSIFGGVKKVIISKKFRGGEVTNIFGGSEIDLSQADFEDGIQLEVTQVFGGTKLIVPANWEIKSEVVNIVGGIEDNRPVHNAAPAGPAKKFRLTGTTVFGGIEIKSY